MRVWLIVVLVALGIGIACGVPTHQAQVGELVTRVYVIDAPTGRCIELIAGGGVRSQVTVRRVDDAQCTRK